MPQVQVHSTITTTLTDLSLFGTGEHIDRIEISIYLEPSYTFLKLVFIKFNVSALAT